MMIDQRVPTALIHMRNMAKRGRKYNVSIMTISHSVVDFLTTIKTNYYIRHFLIQILHNLVVKKYTISGKGKSEFLVVWLF